MVRPTARAAGCLALALLLIVGLAVGGVVWIRSQSLFPPVPLAERCVATAGGSSVAVELDQAAYASIIVGISVRRGLAPRAASIALATAYQETGIRNLDYGDRDSLGLFQQRPSQGWGTPEQLMDPYYATRKFYDALVRIDGWETGDITEIAQRIQRSAYPEAYRDHESDARILASALTGQSRAAFSCLERAGAVGDSAGLQQALRTTFGQVSGSTEGQTLTVRAGDRSLAWAYAHYAVANAAEFGVTAVACGERAWTTDSASVPEWATAPEPQAGNTVSITLR